VVCNQFSDGSYFDFFWAYIGVAMAATHWPAPADKEDGVKLGSHQRTRPVPLGPGWAAGA
jgi:hypothetical protein